MIVEETNKETVIENAKSDNIVSELTMETVLNAVEKAENIQILGCNPFVDVMTDNKFSVKLRKRLEELFSMQKGKITTRPFFTLYMESAQEDFQQQLTDKYGKTNYKVSYIDKKVKIFGDKQANYKSALVTTIVNTIKRRARDDGEEVPTGLLEFVQKNIIVKQLNLSMRYNCLKMDNAIWYCPICLDVNKVEDFVMLESDNEIYKKVNSFLQYLTVNDDQSEKNGFKPDMGGKKFTSSPDDELIEAYDEITNERMAIFARSAFLTLEYKRASIWGFVFNRQGQLLLHQRSQSTKDNRGLWDKSTGGHVDLTDASTVETAKREFIEELYMKDAEFSDYSDTKSEMVVDFGEWRRALRADASFLEAFMPFTGKDKHIIMFRAYVESEKQALTVDRDSVRKITVSKNEITEIIEKPTRFRSDVFFYITAEGEMDTQDQMHKRLNEFESKDEKSKGAATGHRLVTIDQLKKEVMDTSPKRDTEKSERYNQDDYTDDMIHVVKNYWGYLTEFSAFVKDTFARINVLKDD